MAMGAKALAGLMRGISQAMRDRGDSDFRQRTLDSRNQGQEQDRQLARDKFGLNKRYIESLMNRGDSGSEMISPEQMQPLEDVYGTSNSGQPVRRDMLPGVISGMKNNANLKSKDKKDMKNRVWSQANGVSKQIDNLTTQLNKERMELDDESIGDMENRRDELYATLDKIKEYADSMNLVLPFPILRPEREVEGEEEQQIEPGSPAPTMGAGDLIGSGLNKLRELFQR